MNKDDLIKKHRIVKIISIILIVSGFSTYFIGPIITLRISGFFTFFIFIAPIYMLPPLNMYMLPLFTFSSDSLVPLFLNLLFALIFFLFPFIFTFAIYKTIIPLTRKSMLTLMDENALLRNLKMIRDKFFNLFLIFFLFASLISIILITVVYLYLAITLKGSTTINKTQPKSPV